MKLDLNESIRQFSNRGKAFLTRLGPAILDVIYPPICVACEQPLQTSSSSPPFCRQCYQAIRKDEASRCDTCARAGPSWVGNHDSCPQCRRTPPKFSRTFVIGSYENELRLMIRRLKLAAQEPVCLGMGHLLADILEEQFAADPSLAKVSCLVPMPTTFLRQVKRTYNPAELITHAISKRMQIPAKPNLLRFRRKVSKQGTLKTSERLVNLKGAMDLKPGWKMGLSFPRRGLPDLSEQTILLIDDVMTTGATLNEAARVCKNAGAQDVMAAVLARGRVLSR